MNQGQLFYLMGASGAGKDSLIDYAEHHLGKPETVRFVRRHVTRKTTSTNHNRDYYLPEAEFECLRATGYFAMNWERHGICYGITHKINTWLEEGQSVVINGSRQYYKQARQDYPEIQTILIIADLPILRQRLLERGRESAEKINERLLAAEPLVPVNIELNENLIIIDNNGPLKTAGEKLLKQLQP
jgi:ribose 1,5-bisphosphokinase